MIQMVMDVMIAALTLTNVQCIPESVGKAILVLTTLERHQHASSVSQIAQVVNAVMMAAVAVVELVQMEKHVTQINCV